ncbi:MAG: neutral zinc metallopeptidase [Pseudomonadota bacterium]
MRLDDYDPSDDIRDLGRGGGGGFGGGGGGGGLGILFSLLPMLFGRRLGCGGILLILVIGFVVMNSGLLSLGDVSGGAPSAQGQSNGGNVACDTAEERFACNVFGSTHSVWQAAFAERNREYARPTLNFFTDQNQSACGAAQSAMGPFYCPADSGVYIDTAFFAELRDRFGAAGDAAQAYVIAHEVGHHIEKLSGVLDQAQSAQGRGSEADGNVVQVRVELMADCYAGVWANSARTSDGGRAMEAGDMEEAMTAANAIGDDTLMRGSGQRPVPESFTHGTSQQRQRWLRRGLDSGDPAQCDTFGAASL